MTKQTTPDDSLEGRLQRKASLDGVYITKFRQVLFRHGLTMGLVALVCLLAPTANETIQWSTASFLGDYPRYFLVGSMLVIFFLGYLRFSGYSTNGRELFWLAYLLFISIVEEFAFRLLLPNFLMITMGVIPATLLSNLAFAGVHFFTLRWRLINCVGAFLGGLGLSRLLGNTEDIILVVGVHWLVTFLNTPTAPTKQAVQ